MVGEYKEQSIYDYKQSIFNLDQLSAFKLIFFKKKISNDISFNILNYLNISNYMIIKMGKESLWKYKKIDDFLNEYINFEYPQLTELITYMSKHSNHIFPGCNNKKYRPDGIISLVFNHDDNPLSFDYLHEYYPYTLCTKEICEKCNQYMKKLLNCNIVYKLNKNIRFGDYYKCHCINEDNCSGYLKDADNYLDAICIGQINLPELDSYDTIYVSLRTGEVFLHSEWKQGSWGGGDFYRFSLTIDKFSEMYKKYFDVYIEKKSFSDFERSDKNNFLIKDFFTCTNYNNY
jgi:hypothetical protein